MCVCVVYMWLVDNSPNNYFLCTIDIFIMTKMFIFNQVLLFGDVSCTKYFRVLSRNLL